MKVLFRPLTVSHAFSAALIRRLGAGAWWLAYPPLFVLGVRGFVGSSLSPSGRQTDKEMAKLRQESEALRTLAATGSPEEAVAGLERMSARVESLTAEHERGETMGPEAVAAAIARDPVREHLAWARRLAERKALLGAVEASEPAPTAPRKM